MNIPKRVFGERNDRLVVNIGVGAIKIVAKDSNKRVKLRNVSISGYAHGSTAWSDVYLFTKNIIHVGILMVNTLLLTKRIVRI